VAGLKVCFFTAGSGFYLVFYPVVTGDTFNVIKVVETRSQLK
jgi:hypothetical protein